ncbi:hypothetical protein AB0E81_16290 [Streptomyces sp. NPDC033538]|uniref:hypothetical protein n=1 Tax=Streptomyces sp. NPDC033538 TaxID=3155367 RepID=UPI0033F0FB20
MWNAHTAQLPPPLMLRLAWIAAAIAVVATACATRVFLGVHWLNNMVTGALLGAGLDLVIEHLATRSHTATIRPQRQAGDALATPGSFIRRNRWSAKLLEAGREL